MTTPLTEQSTVELALGLRGEEWFPPAIREIAEDWPKEFPDELPSIAWAAAVWLWKMGWVSEGMGGAIPNCLPVGWIPDHTPDECTSDPDPIRATLLAAHAEKAEKAAK